MSLHVYVQMPKHVYILVGARVYVCGPVTPVALEDPESPTVSEHWLRSGPGSLPTCTI